MGFGSAPGPSPGPPLAARRACGANRLLDHLTRLIVAVATPHRRASGLEPRAHHSQVHNQLASQKIFLPAKGSAAIKGAQFVAMQQHAGRQLKLERCRHPARPFRIGIRPRPTDATPPKLPPRTKGGPEPASLSRGWCRQTALLRSRFPPRGSSP